MVFLIYVLQMESVSNRKTAPLMIISEPAASALRLRSLKRKFELSCHSSMIRAPEMTKSTQPKIEMSALRRFSTIELRKCPKINWKIVTKWFLINVFYILFRTYSLHNTWISLFSIHMYEFLLFQFLLSILNKLTYTKRSFINSLSLISLLLISLPDSSL